MADSGIMTVEEVCEYLRVHRSTIYRLLRSKKLAAFRIGSDWRFKRHHIEEFEKRQEQAAAI